jgi:hypothetical protein
MTMLVDVREQVLEEVVHRGFIRRAQLAHLNRHSQSADVVSSCIAAGMYPHAAFAFASAYPHLCHTARPAWTSPSPSSFFSSPASSPVSLFSLLLVILFVSFAFSCSQEGKLKTVLGEKLAVHMGSVNYGMAAPKAHEKRWFVFDERVMQGSLKCVRSTSAVSPWALAALSGDLLLEVGCACGVCSERLHVHPPHPSPHLTPNTHVTHPSHPIHATPYTYLARMHTHTHTHRCHAQAHARVHALLRARLSARVVDV